MHDVAVMQQLETIHLKALPGAGLWYAAYKVSEKVCSNQQEYVTLKGRSATIIVSSENERRIATRSIGRSECRDQSDTVLLPDQDLPSQFQIDSVTRRKVEIWKARCVCSCVGVYQ